MTAQSESGAEIHRLAAVSPLATPETDAADVTASCKPIGLLCSNKKYANLSKQDPVEQFQQGLAEISRSQEQTFSESSGSRSGFTLVSFFHCERQFSRANPSLVRERERDRKGEAEEPKLKCLQSSQSPSPPPPQVRE